MEGERSDVHIFSFDESWWEFYSVDKRVWIWDFRYEFFPNIFSCWNLRDSFGTSFDGYFDISRCKNEEKVFLQKTKLCNCGVHTFFAVCDTSFVGKSERVDEEGAWSSTCGFEHLFYVF